MTLVVILTVRADAADAFAAYERAAAAVMARHGGAVERVVRIPGDASDAPFKEIHVVTFPNDDAFAAYRGDPALAALAATRAAAIIDTQILSGQDAPPYGSEALAGRQSFTGGCHCGRVRFQVTGDLATVTSCNCSICTQKGFLHLIVAQDDFQLLSGQAELTTYTFNTGVARHTFCRHCGMHPFYVPRSDPDKIDVNARCLDGVDVARLFAHRFDGRNWEAAMTRAVPWR